MPHFEQNVCSNTAVVSCSECTQSDSNLGQREPDEQRRENTLSSAAAAAHIELDVAAVHDEAVRILLALLAGPDALSGGGAVGHNRDVVDVATAVCRLP